MDTKANAGIEMTRVQPASGKTRSGLFSRGPVGIVVIVAHVLLIWAIAGSLGVVRFPGLAPPMEASIIDVPQEQQNEPVPVMKPDLEQPQIETPPLENTIPEIEVPVDEPAPAAITAEVSPSPPVPETANMKVDRRVDPIYPPQSRRAGEEGVGVFRVLVDTNGRPSDVQVVKTTGFPRLDDAALQAIRKWTFNAAVQNGQKVQSWTKVQVQFKLENA